ncbi:hypothetical protein C8J56DRAFT_879711 [Mycena floridula]|nr:hypothetical protein C8J56DRAFT_879711 [Mycena floridula]
MSSDSDHTLLTTHSTVSDIPATASSIDDDECASPLYYSMKHIAGGPDAPTAERAEAFYNFEGNPWSRIPDHDNALYLMEPNGSGKARFIVVARIIKGTDNDRSGPYFTAVGGDNMAFQKVSHSRQHERSKGQISPWLSKESDDEPDVPPGAPDLYDNLLKIMMTAEGRFEELKVKEGGTKVISLLVISDDNKLVPLRENVVSHNHWSGKHSVSLALGEQLQHTLIMVKCGVYSHLLASGPVQYDAQGVFQYYGPISRPLSLSAKSGMSKLSIPLKHGMGAREDSPVPLCSTVDIYSTTTYMTQPSRPISQVYLNITTFLGHEAGGGQGAHV